MSTPGIRGLTVASLCATFVALGGYGASAFWHGSASGSGSAATETPALVVLSPGTPSDALLPGARADVVLTVSNPNASQVHIGSLTLDPTEGTQGYAVDGDHPACDVSSLSFSDQSNGGAGWSVPGRVGAEDGTASLMLTDALAMAISAADACQGASFSVYLRAGP